jgi:hypothetical protein
MDRDNQMTRKSGFGDAGKRKDLLAFGPQDLGQNCPQQCPYRENAESGELPESLGEPLSIREVAELIGCSVWTIRQRYLRSGIPFVRFRPHGKLIFYRNQIIHWLLTEQQNGGTIR